MSPLFAAASPLISASKRSPGASSFPYSILAASRRFFNDNDSDRLNPSRVPSLSKSDMLRSMTGYVCDQFHLFFSILSPLKSFFFPWNRYLSVESMSDLPNRRGREMK